MNVNSEIRKKSYVSPVISFDEIEEEQALLAGSRTDGGGSEVDPGNGENTGNDPDLGGSNGAKGATGSLGGGDEYDFVFEYDE
jgi:hypothetical protein